MAFRRRSGFRRRGTFRRRRTGFGSRWGDAGRRAGTVRYRKEWTGLYEDPPCGGLVSWTQTDDDECWAAQNTEILPGTGGKRDDVESTLLAFKGWFQPWTLVNYAGLAGSGTPALSIPVAFITGVGFGLQLVPFRSPLETGRPRFWNDCDNSDWLVRKWYPTVRSPVGITDTGGTLELMPMFDHQSMEIDITPRAVDWSEWALFMTIAISSAEAAEAVLFYQFQGRLLEKYVGGQSAIG